MKKALFVSIHLPSNFSGFRRLYHEIRMFSKDFEVHFIRLNLNESEDRILMKLPDGVKFTEIRCEGRRFDPMFLLYPVFRKQMEKMAWASGQVQDYINREKIDCVILHTRSCSVALRNLDAPAKVAELIDSTDLYYRTKAEHPPSAGNVVIKHINRLFSRVIFSDLVRKFGLFVYITEGDRKEDRFPERQTFVSLEARDPPLEDAGAGKRDIDVLLFGLWRHPPNRDGLREILPRLGGIKGKVAIIGLDLDKSLAFPPNVEAIGFVENLSEYLLRSKIALVPVFYGAGLQNKVFDALRHGCKVVSTSFTKEKFESSGFVSESVIYSEDLVKAVNDALERYSIKDVAAAYEAYKGWYGISTEKETQYVDAIKRMLREKGA
jgi:hypothetical protein